ncbi:MAG: 2-succinyl-5-enolpyruvyl-6-hydroxy-3-cyclohexene-1-carboxylic-acid synthase [Anaerohalosphaera sp.]|nr:2-succinyl-5-enolpyruvyl-6-hydroxy-3-cyclohexene-1-carboxylic-acid synthase [Anaerohalosphaera sp.]
MGKTNLNTLWAQVVIEELVRLGVTYFCVCPGSRSTPLVAAIAKNARAKCTMIYDERGAGYHAVGYAKATGKPTAVVTTSGTAVANLLPAVTESSRGSVPLIVLTADRPYRLIINGSNQTIEQPDIFGSFTRFSYDMDCPNKGTKLEYVLAAVDQAYESATVSHPGPVHINCRYDEPLEPIGEIGFANQTEHIKRWNDCDKQFLSTSEQPELNKKILKCLAKKINRASRGMVLVGELTTQAEQVAVLKLIEKLAWPVYADIISQLRLSTACPGVHRYFDQELLSDEFNAEAKPDLVLHIGGRITSKRVPQFFAENRPGDFVVIKNTPDRYDPSEATTELVHADVEDACNFLVSKLERKERGVFTELYEGMNKRVDAVVEEMVSGNPSLSEAFIARQLSKMIGENSSLFLSSSMPIRDMDLYAVTNRANIKVGANRGVSGIDGVISSASGFAEGSRAETTLLIGDLAFIHDINALSGLRNLSQPLIIVVVNNQGGGIFHFLPISRHEEIFEKYFAAPHDFAFDGAAKTFNVDYYKAVDKKQFIDAYNTAVIRSVPAIIECATDRKANLDMRRAMKIKILETLQQ